MAETIEMPGAEGDLPEYSEESEVDEEDPDEQARQHLLGPWSRLPDPEEVTQVVRTAWETTFNGGGGEPLLLGATVPPTVPVIFAPDPAHELVEWWLAHGLDDQDPPYWGDATLWSNEAQDMLGDLRVRQVMTLARSESWPTRRIFEMVLVGGVWSINKLVHVAPIDLFPEDVPAANGLIDLGKQLLTASRAHLLEAIKTRGATARANLRQDPSGPGNGSQDPAKSKSGNAPALAGPPALAKIVPMEDADYVSIRKKMEVKRGAPYAMQELPSRYLIRLLEACIESGAWDKLSLAFCAPAYFYEEAMVRQSIKGKVDTGADDRILWDMDLGKVTSRDSSKRWMLPSLDWSQVPTFLTVLGHGLVWVNEMTETQVIAVAAHFRDKLLFAGAGEVYALGEHDFRVEVIRRRNAARSTYGVAAISVMAEAESLIWNHLFFVRTDTNILHHGSNRRLYGPKPDPLALTLGGTRRPPGAPPPAPAAAVTDVDAPPKKKKKPRKPKKGAKAKAVAKPPKPTADPRPKADSLKALDFSCACCFTCTDKGCSKGKDCLRANFHPGESGY